MNGDEIDGLWSVLQPSPSGRRRIDARVSEWLEARDTSLASEWIELFRFAPLPALGLVAASIVAIATAPPFIWVARSLF